jgi:hypothetical protein
MNDNEMKDLYKDADSRLNTIVAPDKYKFWTMLRRIRDEYAGDNANLTVVDVDFKTYLENKWGLRIHIDEATGGVMADYTIIDEGKYMLALLKFT